MARFSFLVSAGLLALTACGNAAETLPSGATYGPNPEMPAPKTGGLPVIGVMKTAPWPDGRAPTAPAGFSVTRFADGLDHPRWLYVLPNGDVLVAESSTEAQKGGGIMGWIRNMVQKRAGALSVSANRITLLRDADHDGTAETKSVFLKDLNQPFGMVLVGNNFYVGNTDSVMRFPYQPGETQITAQGQKIADLPYHAKDNGHWTRNIVSNADGTKLYVAVGSASNIADQGLAVEENRAAILEMNPDGSGQRVFASGLRNPNGMDWEPVTGALWTAVNERDMLGDDLVPDYMTSVKDGGFYGWPYSYFGQHPDPRMAKQQNPELVAKAIVPDFALGAHTASLGLTFYDGATFPAHYRGGAFVGQHGSWNRSQISGYKVVFVPFANGKPSGQAENFLTGFVDDNQLAQGRPVGVVVDPAGALLVADDVGNIVWRVATH